MTIRLFGTLLCGAFLVLVTSVGSYAEKGKGGKQRHLTTVNGINYDFQGPGEFTRTHQGSGGGAGKIKRSKATKAGTIVKVDPATREDTKRQK